jgi:small subunit ribosomal protein S16
VAYVGNYDPHTKSTTLDSEKISQYLSNGAQPSGRVASLLQKEGIKLPDWVKVEQPKERAVRNPEKRRSTAPVQPAAETPVTEETPEDISEEAAAETATEPVAEAATEAEPATLEAPAEEAAEEPVASDEA